jgi:hypothetical protein
MADTDAISSLAFAKLKLSVSNSAFHISLAIGPLLLHFLLVVLNGAKNDALPLVLHATDEENKGKELTFGGFKSSFLVDT